MLHANQRVKAFEAWKNTSGVERPNLYESYVEGSRETLRLVVEYLEANSERAGRLSGTDYSRGESEGLRQAANYLASGLTSDTSETKVSE
jgi:hypothetical protein